MFRVAHCDVVWCRLIRQYYVRYSAAHEMIPCRQVQQDQDQTATADAFHHVCLGSEELCVAGPFPSTEARSYTVHNKQ